MVFVLHTSGRVLARRSLSAPLHSVYISNNCRFLVTGSATDIVVRWLHNLLPYQVSCVGVVGCLGVASMTLCCVAAWLLVADCGARDAAIHGDCTDRDA